MNGNVHTSNWNRRQSLHLTALLAIACLVFAGCQTGSVHWSKADTFAGKKTKKETEPKFGSPERMVVIWKDSVFEHPTNGPARGFGGRVFFYDQGETPIRVDGELTIYGFNDSSGQNATEADKKFVFEKSMLQEHYSNTGLGPSYSVWVPWDKVGGENLSISLIPVFRDDAGKIVRGGQTVNVLPGRNALAAVESERVASNSDKAMNPNSPRFTPGVQEIPTGDYNAYGSDFENRQVAHLISEETGEPSQRGGVRLRTTTISLPNDTAMRLQQAARKPIAPPTQPALPAAAPVMTHSPSNLKQQVHFDSANSNPDPILKTAEAENGLEPGRGKSWFQANQSNYDSSNSAFGKPGSLR